MSPLTKFLLYCLHENYTPNVIEDAERGFINVGRDEDGRKVGCCTICSRNGVLLNEHIC